jgi:hypothetical protein
MHDTANEKTQLIRAMLVGDRDPDQIISDHVDGVDVPYLVRWWVKQKAEVDQPSVANIYLHLFLRSDYDRALHDHPFDSTSIILQGSYREHLADGTSRILVEGDVVTRKAEDAHRIELIDEQPVWTLFIRGPKVREWGFLTGPSGWTHWIDFVK